MEWTPEALNAELEYRRGDLDARRHLREVREARQPRWWQRLRVHRPDDGNGERHAA
ncbi:hypothetical protein [Kibdelosporangium phytohabitans]|uniref:hypothetical protein n=1 Tax=Kibdelosporangium phytohabitans TaxID=860235 RepID=UPI0012FAAF33|nr:hypothetical protein [Kibdelosporangium phytohabitans]MBE1464438.1 hypothetical protein [Kibdelosporangium phytohabitans]